MPRFFCQVFHGIYYALSIVCHIYSKYKDTYFYLNKINNHLINMKKE